MMRTMRDAFMRYLYRLIRYPAGLLPCTYSNSYDIRRLREKTLFGVRKLSAAHAPTPVKIFERTV